MSNKIIKIFNDFEIELIPNFTFVKIIIHKNNSNNIYESTFNLNYINKFVLNELISSIDDFIDTISLMIKQKNITIEEYKNYLKLILNKGELILNKQFIILDNKSLILKKKKEIKVHEKSITSISTFISGNFISVSNDKTINIYNINLNIIQKIKNAHNDYINYVDIKDENNFVTCSYDKNIKTWIKKGNEFILNQIINNAHDDSINKVLYFSNKKLISCSYDKTIKIWELTNQNTYQCITSLYDSNYIFSILLLEDKNILISSGVDGTKLYNLNNFEFIIYIKEACCLSPNSLKRIDEDRIIIGGGCIDIMKIISISEKKIINEIENEFYRYGICIIKEKGIFLTGGRGGIIRIYKINNYQCIQIIENAYGDFNNYDIIPIINGIIELKNRLIITYSNDNNLKIWEFKD